MTRIQHGSWDKRSEADLLEASQRNCQAGWDFDPAFQLIQQDGQGLSDTMCNIYYAFDRPYLGCGDRSGRALLLGNYTALETIDDQKWWLHNIGPITCAIDVYKDFFEWNSSTMGVYRHDPSYTQLYGAHALLIVGYDDDKECWIVKNSWGSSWGDGGYIEIG